MPAFDRRQYWGPLDQAAGGGEPMPQDVPVGLGGTNARGQMGQPYQPSASAPGLANWLTEAPVQQAVEAPMTVPAQQAGATGPDMSALERAAGQVGPVVAASPYAAAGPAAGPQASYTRMRPHWNPALAQAVATQQSGAASAVAPPPSTPAPVTAYGQPPAAPDVPPGAPVVAGGFRPRADGAPGSAPADWVESGGSYYPTSIVPWLGQYQQQLAAAQRPVAPPVAPVAPPPAAAAPPVPPPSVPPAAVAPPAAPAVPPAPWVNGQPPGFVANGLAPPPLPINPGGQALTAAQLAALAGTGLPGDPFTGGFTPNVGWNASNGGKTPEQMAAEVAAYKAQYGDPNVTTQQVQQQLAATPDEAEVRRRAEQEITDSYGRFGLTPTEEQRQAIYARVGAPAPAPVATAYPPPAAPPPPPAPEPTPGTLTTAPISDPYRTQPPAPPPRPAAEPVTTPYPKPSLPPDSIKAPAGAPAPYKPVTTWAAQGLRPGGF